MTEQNLSDSWIQLEECIRTHSRFLVSSHVHPDGDAVGASLAFKRTLERLGKDVAWVMNEDPGKMYEQFYEEDEIEIYQDGMSDFSDREAIAMVDAGEWSRLGDLGTVLQRHPGDKICIDHHLMTGDFEGLKIVDTKSPSTTVLLYRFLKHLGMELTFDIAEPIYLGLIVDTQNFHLPNTTEEAHYIAADCLKAGVEPVKVHEPIYGTTSVSRIRLLAEVFHTLEIYCGGIIAVIYTTQDMFEKHGANKWDDEGFSDLVRSIEGVRVGIYMREEPNGTIKVSWRAKGDNNVAVSAKRFGGGGHMRAAGCFFQGTLEEVKNQILNDMEHRVRKGEIS